ncbi:LLM class flavin-dependent oxidoreductase [Cupriavidus basilensis]
MRSRAGGCSLGVGSGYLKHEFEGYDVDPAIKRERFDEALMLVERLLAGERVHHAGQFHHAARRAPQRSARAGPRADPRGDPAARGRVSHWPARAAHAVRAVCLGRALRRHPHVDGRLPARPGRSGHC